MKIYLRNLIILSLVGTLNYLIFILVTGRPYLFTRRYTMENAAANDVDLLRKENLRLKALIQLYDKQQRLPNVSVENSAGVTAMKEVPFKEDLAVPSTLINATDIKKVAKANATLDSHTGLSLIKKEPPVIGYADLHRMDTAHHINPHTYPLLLDEPSTCYNTSAIPSDVFLVVLVATIHNNFEQRSAIRETWGSPTDVHGKKVRTLFLLARNKDAHLQKLVQEESDEHHDIIQEDFRDSYKNLTLKTIMAMKWVSTHCAHAAYLMKTDDDMYVSYANLVKYLSSDGRPTTRLAFGFLINAGPIRDPKNKWYMPVSLYPETRYPPFLSGTGYVLSVDLAKKIYEISLDTMYLHLEDVFVAVCLHKLKVVPIKNHSFNNWRTPYSYCRFHKIITTHMVSPSEMHRIWSDQKRSHNVHC